MNRRRWIASVGVAFAPILGCSVPLFPAARSNMDQRMERVLISESKEGFVLERSGRTFIPWGFNYVGDFGRILEEYWEEVGVQVLVKQIACYLRRVV